MEEKYIKGLWLQKSQEIYFEVHHKTWWSSQQIMKACLETTSMVCSRENVIGLSIIQQKHTYLKENYGLEALQLLWLWKKSILRDCDYRNHRRFTLRCISKDIVQVSVRLWSACSKISQGARKIIEKAEKQLIQDRVRWQMATPSTIAG